MAHYWIYLRKDKPSEGKDIADETLFWFFFFRLKLYFKAEGANSFHDIILTAHKHTAH